MNTTTILKLLALVLLFPSASFLSAQDNEKEVIIIEKTIDAEGNVISKNIKRNKGNYSEDDIQEMLDDGGDMPMIRSFDLEGMGFGDDLSSLFSPREKQKPSLGVALKIENDQLVVTSVIERSGASNADIRAGDKIISVNNIPVATVEDIQDVLSNHEHGDKLEVVVWRDGQELEKSVLLKSNNFEGLFDGGSFQFPEGGMQFFGGDLDIDLDSLLSQFRGMELGEDFFDMEGFDFDQLRQLRGTDDESPTTNRKKYNSNSETEKPQLGLFIEDKTEGIVVTEVIDRSAAAKAGMKEGDLITHIDDNVIGSYRELSAWMNTKSIGDEAIITVERSGKSKEIKVKL